ncbi:MAG: cell envelope integrity protein TolA [Luteimonas sp.]
MKPSRAEDARAIGLALLLHVVLFGLIVLGMLWTRSSAPLSAAGSPVEADVIDPNALTAATRRALATKPAPLPTPEPVVEPAPEPVVEPLPEPVEETVAPPPQPEPEPRPEDAPTPPQQVAQERVPVPDEIDQVAVRRDAIAREAREREQEAKRRQEQIDLTERERQAEAERKQRLAQQQKDTEELKKIQAERAKLQREAQLAEQKLKQLADRRAQQASAQAAESASASNASPPPGNNGEDAALAARYAAAIQEAVKRNWTRPDSVPLGQKCRINIRQLPGGRVIEAKVDPSCPYDEQGRRSIEQAVKLAEPLPYAGFEKVFNRTLLLNFTAQD